MSIIQVKEWISARRGDYGMKKKVMVAVALLAIPMCTAADAQPAQGVKRHKPYRGR